MSKYEAYIAEHSLNYAEAFGACAQATLLMQKEFPELRRVRGHYYCYVWGERGHWWLVDPDGKVIDPTAMQFPSQGKGEYVEWVEGAEEPVGKCLNCGEVVYASKAPSHNFCTLACDTAYVSFLNRPRL